MAVKAKFIKSVPIFGNASGEVVEALVLQLKNAISLPNEAVITQGACGAFEFLFLAPSLQNMSQFPVNKPFSYTPFKTDRIHPRNCFSSHI